MGLFGCRELCVVKFLLTFITMRAFRGRYSFYRRINTACFADSLSNGNYDPIIALPRLNADIPRLYDWITHNNGEMKTKIIVSTAGWSLSTDSEVKTNEILARIPKTLCITADPATTPKLSENAMNLMQSLDPTSWRARLAIALLSERSQASKSIFEPFIHNLPQEFRGMPLFFDRTEATYVQDDVLTNKAALQSRFFHEFCDQVLKPLRKTKQDPFAGQINEKQLIDAFGWAFAIASSRAVRPDAIENYPRGNSNHNNAVFIPGIDIAQHSFTPSCMVLDGDDEFILMSNKDLPKDSAVTINYGHMTNDEFMLDYGFTVDNNPYDNIEFECNLDLINTARSVMRQSNFTFVSPSIVSFSNSQLSKPAFNTISARSIGVNQLHDIFSEQSLALWQTFWLRGLCLYAPFTDTIMTIGGIEPTTASKTVENSEKKVQKESLVDSRLWAMLRVMYSEHEDDLRRHGYDPFVLQSPGSLLTPAVEAHVIKTMIGMLLIILRSYGTDVERDIDHLSRGVKNIYRTYTAETMDVNTIRRECLKILRSIINNSSSSKSLKDKSTLELINMINPDKNQLAPNLLTAMQFRIHKKRLLVRVIQHLATMHEQLVIAGEEMNESNIEHLEEMLQHELKLSGGETGEALTKEQTTQRLLNFIDSVRIFSAHVQSLYYIDCFLFNTILL